MEYVALVLYIAYNVCVCAIYCTSIYEACSNSVQQADDLLSHNLFMIWEMRKI